MLFGYESKTAVFKKLIKEGKLSHAYLFYGDEGIGKKTFAGSLAAAIETGEWEKPQRPPIDALFLAPGENGSLGIEAVGEAKNFLWQKPIASPRRTLVIGEAERLTTEAEGALLKVVEEPPEHALIIFVAKNRELFLPPLLSRLEKIYFPRLPVGEVERFLAEERGTAKETAKRIAGQSFGSIGRALSVLSGEKPAADGVLGNLREEIMRLRRTDVMGNARKLRWLLERELSISRYNLNMNLQKKAIQEMLNN